MDAQHWILPAQFANESLLNILIVDNGSPYLQRTILSAITICGNKNIAKHKKRYFFYYYHLFFAVKSNSKKQNKTIKK